MSVIKESINNLNELIIKKNNNYYLTFEQFLEDTLENPHSRLRNIFQAFHDMIFHYIGQGVDEYPNDPESMRYLRYNTEKLFHNESYRPFFADRIFTHRFVNAVKAMKNSTQQNKIYIFNGPPGCGKSTFLNNLLLKFEEYSNSDVGLRYETVWRFKHTMFNHIEDDRTTLLLKQLIQVLSNGQGKDIQQPQFEVDGHSPFYEYVDIPCPNHDHPILVIPKRYRKELLGNIFKGHEFYKKLFNSKEYDWVFKEKPCTICSSIYKSLMNRYRSFDKVLEMLFARPYQFNKRLGEGITVFNPGDELRGDRVLTDDFFQKKLNSLFINEGNKVKYIYSTFSKTNNGVYGLMDIKSHNTDRLIRLHNIISEGIHKVEDIEESVKSLLIAVMNPEDQKNIEEFQSFLDRIEYISVPYVLDLNTEVQIYKTIFGEKIESKFLPRVLQNFARLIISTRILHKAGKLLQLVENPSKYKLYCDKNLSLLKMDLYAGHIPDWLTNSDRKRLNAKLRREIIDGAKLEGDKGISGRDSISIFSRFFNHYSKKNRLIAMSDLIDFFTKIHEDLSNKIPQEFIDSLVQMYDYTVLQEVKESLFYYNKLQISKDIQNYLFAINFEPGDTETCTYTSETIHITEDFYTNFEKRILGTTYTKGSALLFRKETQREYTSNTLTQEIMVKGKNITKTKIYKNLHDRYSYNLKEKVLEPFLDNENFRRAIKDYDNKDFKSYDKRIRMDVRYLVRNLCKKFKYTSKGAKEVCMYVIDNNLAKKFSNT